MKKIIKTQLALVLFLGAVNFSTFGGQSASKGRGIVNVKRLNNQFLEAAKEGNAAEVGALLDRGADIEAKNKWGETALIWAAWAGQYEVIKLLLDRGANIEAFDKGLGRTPLIHAASRGQSEVVTLLLDSHANIEAKDNEGATALIRAVLIGNARTVKILLDRDADMESKNNDGVTALTLAADRFPCAYDEIVKLLLDAGANIEAKNKYENTALILAAANGKTKTVKLLLDKGAKLEIKDEEGKTALVRAACGGSAEVVKLLLDEGANPETALIAVAKLDYIPNVVGMLAVVNILIEAGAVIPDPEKYACIRCYDKYYDIKHALDVAWELLQKPGRLTKSAGKECRRVGPADEAGAGAE